ncbi:hypothetical protein CHH57_01795 [Niallia circulans]|uniref:Uncharacterized protein n=1 Tax=Niallia circulans TaxID=1397 RepID=A0AA91TW85_NIACI|nr:hypothetical protein [Niallia circulans]PAD85068.1 hypothetical protein CHH57_01795 [Niallia circulans]
MAEWVECEQCKNLYRMEKPFVCKDCNNINSFKNKINETVYYWKNLNVYKATLLNVNDNGQLLLILPNGEWLIKNFRDVITNNRFKKEGLEAYLLPRI